MFLSIKLDTSVLNECLDCDQPALCEQQEGRSEVVAEGGLLDLGGFYNSAGDLQAVRHVLGVAARVVQKLTQHVLVHLE